MNIKFKKIFMNGKEWLEVIITRPNAIYYRHNRELFELYNGFYEFDLIKQVIRYIEEKFIETLDEQEKEEIMDKVMEELKRGK